MKKILGLVITMVILVTGCGAEVTNHIYYNSDDGSYKLVAEVYVDDDNIEKIEGGVESVDLIVENTFSDSDEITSEDDKFGKTYYVEYNFDSLDEINEFAEENSENKVLGINSSLESDYYDGGLEYTIDVQYDFDDYLDYYIIEAVNYINNRELTDSEVDEYDMISGYVDNELYYDDELMQNGTYSEEIDIKASTYNLDFKIDDTGIINNTELISIIDISAYNFDGVADGVASYIEESCSLEPSEINDDTLEYKISNNKSDYTDITCYASLLNVNNFDFPICTESESFFYEKLKCDFPSYDGISFTGDSEVKIEATIKGESVKVTPGKSNEISSLKTSSIIIIVLSVVGLIALLFVLKFLWKKYDLSFSKIKKKSVEVSAKVKDQAVEIGGKTAKAAVELKDKATEMAENKSNNNQASNQQVVESTDTTSSTSVVAPSSESNPSQTEYVNVNNSNFGQKNIFKFDNASIMMFIAILLVTVGIYTISDRLYDLPTVKLNSKTIADLYKFATYDSGFDIYKFVWFLESAKWFIVFVMVVGAIVNVLLSINGTSKSIQRLISILVYGVMILYFGVVLITFIICKIDGSNLGISLTVILAFIIAVLGLISNILYNDFANKVRRIRLFKLLAIAFIFVLATYTVTAKFDLYFLTGEFSISLFSLIALCIENDIYLIYLFTFAILFAGFITTIIFFIMDRKKNVYSKLIYPIILIILNIVFLMLFIVVSLTSEVTLNPPALLFIVIIVSIFEIIKNTILKEDE